MLDMNWETIAFVAFSAIGVIQYVKGLVKEVPGWVWALVQPALCLILAAAWTYMPAWVAQGILALAISQIGYETIIQTVKKRLGTPATPATEGGKK